MIPVEKRQATSVCWFLTVCQKPTQSHLTALTIEKSGWGDALGWLIPPRGWAGVELQVISAVGHGDCSIGVDDL